jgi:glycogen debranching enzyme
VHEDTRFVSRWELRLDGRPLSLLKSAPVDYDSAAFFLTNPETPRLRAYSVAVRRLRLVGSGALEQIEVFNTSSESISCELRLLCGADFADLFEIKSSVRDRSGAVAVSAGPARRSLRFRYQVSGFRAETTIWIERSEIVEGATERVVADARPSIDGADAVWTLELPARCSLLTLVKVAVQVNTVTFEPAAEGFGGPEQSAEGPMSGWLERIPRIEAKSGLLSSVLRQSVVDLAALRITGDLLGENYVLPAAGLPWFMTLFGRDTLITSLQTLWIGPGLARGALHLLGALQGTGIDDFRDEEPGKIMHEVRSGELTRLGEMPHSPYYGTADATPLWLILLSEYWRFTGDDAFVLARWNKVGAALTWIDRYGDRDGDGYVEYQTRSQQGLGNQCWKDSWDGVQFADGTIPHLPIATAEIQGYVYDAKLRVAELAQRLRADVTLAERLEREAEELYRRFNKDFWS